MAVLGNYVRLEAGKPKRLHFVNHEFVDKVIRDPLTGVAKTVRVLQFYVDYEDGQKVSKVFSVTSEKLAAALSPYLEDRRYTRLEFTIIKSGSGFLTDYSVSVRPWAGV
jgi:hypothetical protein